MGANCCVAAKDKLLPDRNCHELSTHRNIRYSPSWSFRWDNRTHIEDVVENMLCFSHHNSGNATSEDGESPPKSFPFSHRRKACLSGSSDNSKLIAADQTTPVNSSPEGKSSLKSPPAVKVDDPSSSTSGSRKARRSPDYKLCRQISHSRIPSLKSLNEDSSPEVGRRSFALNNELSAEESHGGSSDGWSMRTFSELVAASSQRKRWSFDSDNLASFTNKMFGPTLHTCCFICSKPLKEKSPWSTHKIVSTNDLPIVSVLVCSHVYHAECLESSTSELEIYDPSCPVCENNVVTPSPKQFGKFDLRGRNKISRIADVDVNVDVDVDVDVDSISNGRRSGKRAIMGASSSTKSSFARPFLKRHSASQNDTIRKKGFWARYRKE